MCFFRKRPTSKRFFCLLTAGAALVLCLIPQNAQALEKKSLFWILDAQSLGGYSQIQGKSGIGTTLNDWLVSPVLKLREDLHWINIYNGYYNRSAQVVSQEQGGQSAQTTQGHNLSTAFKYKVNNQWSLHPLFYTNWSFVQETKDESFGNGLYDYRDIGGGLESSWITFTSKQKQDEIRLGFQFFERQYPNYRSLECEFEPSGCIEENEKDFYGYKWNLGFNSRSRDDWSWGLESISLYKDFTDKKTIDENGVLQPDGRQDFAQYVNGYASHSLAKDILFRLEGQFIVNVSNLDLYDTHLTLTPVDDDFIGNYYNYLSFTVRPTVTYTKNIAKDMNFSLTLGYSFNLLYYPDRNTQDASGVYQSSNEQDINHTFSVKTSYPLTKYVSWVSSASYTIVNSNQDFEQFYLYSYDLWSAVTGISFKY